MELGRYTSVTNGQKTCTSCGVDKGIEEFYFYKKNGTEYPYPRCKPCENQRSSKWAQANPDKVALHRENQRKRNPDYFREYALKRNYGMLPEEYDAIWDNQDGKCGICGKQDDGRRGLLVDHNHDTGQIRGLLCVECNTGLGMFRDSSEFLRLAIGYLDRMDELGGRDQTALHRRPL